MKENKDYYLNITHDDFEEFKHDLNARDMKGAYRLVSLQKFSYFQTKLMLDMGVDSAGKSFTDEEMEFLKIILKQIVSNLETLKEDYEYTPKDQA